MGARNKAEDIRPLVEVMAFTLVGDVVVATAVLGILYGGPPAAVVIFLVLATGGLWWWQAARKREGDNRDGGRLRRPRRTLILGPGPSARREQGGHFRF